MPNLRRWFARTLKLVLGLTLFSALAAGFLGGCVFAGPKYRGPVTDHFDGERFHNLVPQPPSAGAGGMLKWVMNRDPGPWRSYEEFPPGPPPPHRVGPGELRVTFVNHASVLVQLDGLNVLTDPQWSEYASPVSFAGPRRRRPPGIRFEDLPPIDVIVISHNHYDHLDLPTLRRLVAAFPNVRIYTPLGVDLLLEREHLPHQPSLDWWQQVTLSPDVKLISVPVQHFSARGLGDQNCTLWSGWVLEGPSGRTYFGGDTGYGPHFKMVRERLGASRVALLPIGAFRPEWFMGHVHVSPSEAVQAAIDLDASTSVGMHFGTFPLADDGQDEPVQKLEESLKALGDKAPRFWVLGFGEGREVPPVATP